jgi:hypothetical protein
MEMTVETSRTSHQATTLVQNRNAVPTGVSSVSSSGASVDAAVPEPAAQPSVGNAIVKKAVITRKAVISKPLPGGSSVVKKAVIIKKAVVGELLHPPVGPSVAESFKHPYRAKDICWRCCEDTWDWKDPDLGFTKAQWQEEWDESWWSNGIILSCEDSPWKEATNDPHLSSCELNEVMKASVFTQPTARCPFMLEHALITQSPNWAVANGTNGARVNSASTALSLSAQRTALARAHPEVDTRICQTCWHTHRREWLNWFANYYADKWVWVESVDYETGVIEWFGSVSQHTVRVVTVVDTLPEGHCPCHDFEIPDPCFYFLEQFLLTQSRENGTASDSLAG